MCYRAQKSSAMMVLFLIIPLIITYGCSRKTQQDKRARVAPQTEVPETAAATQEAASIAKTRHQGLEGDTEPTDITVASSDPTTGAGVASSGIAPSDLGEITGQTLSDQDKDDTIEALRATLRVVGVVDDRDENLPEFYEVTFSHNVNPVTGMRSYKAHRIADCSAAQKVDIYGSVPREEDYLKVIASTSLEFESFASDSNPVIRCNSPDDYTLYHKLDVTDLYYLKIASDEENIYQIHSSMIHHLGLDVTVAEAYDFGESWPIYKLSCIEDLENNDEG